MSDSNDAGVVHALLENFNNKQFPRMQEIKAKAERGEKLSDYELEFLEHTLNEVRSINHLLDRHPEYHEFASRVMTLYKEIATAALANEPKA